MIAIYVLALGLALFLFTRFTIFVGREKNAYLDRIVQSRTQNLRENNRHLHSDLERATKRNAKLITTRDELLNRSLTAEKRLAHSNAELKDANRDLEALSHTLVQDLRAPLIKMQAFAHTLRLPHHSVTERERAEMCAFIAVQCERLTSRVESLLSLSTGSQSDLAWQKVPLTPLIDEVRRHLMTERASHNVIWKLTDPLPIIAGDPPLLRQLFVHIVSNALKFSSDKPTAKIQITASSSSRPDYIDISISDDGIGFDEASATDILKPFHQLNNPNRYPGSGTGLTNAQRIATRHDGSIRATGAPREGVTFVITLPTRPPSIIIT
ncbi:MAG: hypothetical protein J6386_20595 [Candidatus Synoicihabitans palmerolidicus]|nr:hypothetical protein [Candidatus Synoicihabitans palmerolidicus]